MTEVIVSTTTETSKDEHYALIGMYIIIFLFVLLSWTIFGRSSEEYKWFDLLVYVVIILHAIGIFILNQSFEPTKADFGVTFRMTYYYAIDVIYFNVLIRTVSMRNSGIILLTIFYIGYILATNDNRFETYAVLYII